MNEGLNNEFKITPEQKNIEWKNHIDMLNHFKEEFSKILKENPIQIFTKNADYPAEKLRGIDNIKNVNIDESGTGGIVSVNFSYDDYISVTTKGFSGSSPFNKKYDFYKINEVSFQNILTMMDELIKRSGYSEQEKSKMFQFVVDGLKDKVIKDEEIKKVK